MEKKDIKSSYEEKKESPIEIDKKINKETISWLTKLETSILENDLWYEVKNGENIWRIVYEHSKNANHLPLSADELSWISINPWDKIFFTNDKLIIKKWNKYNTIKLTPKIKTNTQKKSEDIVKSEKIKNENPIKKIDVSTKEEAKKTENNNKEIPNNEEIKIKKNEKENLVEKKEELVKEKNNWNIKEIELWLIDLTQNQKIITTKTNNIDETKLKEKSKNKNIKENNENKNISLEDFFKLDKNKRFEIITKKQDNWYYEISFPNKEIEKITKIDDIIPNEFKYCEVIKNKEFLENNWKKAKLNYFDIVSRINPQDNFSSIFSWEEYWKTTILNWYLIKPIKNINLKTNSNQIFDYLHIAKTWDYKDNINEENIRSIYWDYIKNLCSFIPIWSVIDEKLVYSIIAKESKFNPNAISPTQARWLWQLTIQAINEILKLNESKVQKDWNPWDLLITKEILFKISKNIKIDNNWNISWLETELYYPKNNIKFIINYLIILEEIFSKYSLPRELKRDIIVASYNTWPNTIKELLENKYFSKINENSYVKDIKKTYKKQSKSWIHQ